MDQRDCFRGQRITLGSNLAELAPDDDKAVRSFDQLVCDARIAAEEPDRKRMRAGDAALAAHRMRDRDRLRLGKRQKRRVRPREVDAAADQEQRSLSERDQRGGAGNVRPIRPDAPRRHAQRRRVDREILGRKVMLAVADVLGNVEQHRPRPAGSRHREGAPQQLRDAAGHFDPDQLLDCRPQDLRLSAFLRHVLPGMCAIGVASQRNDWHPGVEALNKAGHKVGGAGPERTVADPRSVGDPRIGVRCRGAAPLVIDQEVPQAELRQRVVKRQELKPAHPKHRPDLGEPQHLGERAAAGHAA